MQVGDVTQSITVESTGALLQAENPSLGTVIQNQAITQLPLNGANYLSLVALSANTNTLSPTAGQAGARLGGSRASQSISVGGQRIMFDHYTLDGINNSDVDFNSFVVQPSIDAIQEFKVQTGVYPAQFGYNATQINVVTKSGTNQYHGTAFEFLRNNYADARGYNYSPSPLPAALPFKYNDYGFVLGGPITIPKVFNGRDRFFFMANYERFSQINVGSATATLPTAAILGGDFSTLHCESARLGGSDLRSKHRREWCGQNSVLLQWSAQRDLSEPDRSNLGQYFETVLPRGNNIGLHKQLQVRNSRNR